MASAGRARERERESFKERERSVLGLLGGVFGGGERSCSVVRGD